MSCLNNSWLSKWSNESMTMVTVVGGGPGPSTQGPTVQSGERWILTVHAVDSFLGMAHPARQIKQMDRNQKECAKRVEKLLEKHAWIAREKPMFGKQGTDYDFGAQDARGARHQLETTLAK